MKKRTGVLIHSRYLQTHDWERIMWGEPPHRQDDLLGAIRHKMAKMLLQQDKFLEIKKALGL